MRPAGLIWLFTLLLAGCSAREGTPPDVGDAKANGGDRRPASTMLDPKYREISGLEVGLKVTHSPNPVKARPDQRSGRRLSWVFATTVEAVGEPVTITEFGAFAWVDGVWVFANFTGDPFTPEEFADWYSCPGAEVTRGKKFTDPKNWGGGDDLRAEKSLWYFVGVTASGRKVKGEAVVEHAGEMER